MSQQHWDAVYSRNDSRSVSWFQPEAAMSLQLIKRSNLPGGSHVIDVGAGASVLADSLLDLGVARLTVLDLAEAALQSSRQRLGERAALVDWQVGDILQHPLPGAYYDLWHDRAVFHFMTETAQRDAYRRQLRHALKPGGLLIIGTFASDGPEQCSGLPVCRYDCAALAAEFSDQFTLLAVESELHQTPAGRTQSFSWLCLQKNS
jgi:2-polyprenyl-3-methyl-5-hydroxy-6-metoxy-1,4-benzoquinol methylase